MAVGVYGVLGMGRCVGRVVGGRVTGKWVCGCWLVVLIGVGPNGTLSGNRVVGVYLFIYLCVVISCWIGREMVQCVLYMVS